jgi:hypothetical protein
MQSIISNWPSVRLSFYTALSAALPAPDVADFSVRRKKNLKKRYRPADERVLFMGWLIAISRKLAAVEIPLTRSVFVNSVLFNPCFIYSPLGQWPVKSTLYFMSEPSLRRCENAVRILLQT